MYELVHTSPEVVIPELIDIFQGDDGSRALIAGDLLSRFGKDAIPPFIDALRSETDDDRKLEITSFLIRIGEDAIPDLVARLGDEDICSLCHGNIKRYWQTCSTRMMCLMVKSPDILHH